MAKTGPHKGGQEEGTVRPKFTVYWTQDEIKDYMFWLKENYKSDPQLAKYVGDHLFGKPIQPLTGEGGGPIQFTKVTVKVLK